MVREVEVVAAERSGHPIGNPDQRRPIEIGSDAWIHAGMEERILGEANGAIHPGQGYWDMPNTRKARPWKGKAWKGWTEA